MMAKRLTELEKAVRVASKRLPVVRGKLLDERLNWACGTLADAYRIGIDEAQEAIVYRLQQLSKPTE